jgi:glycosyltransferase involved in cell wall biosynthesis
MKQRIALILDNEPKSGGVFYNQINLINNILKIKNYDFLIISTNKNNNEFLKKENLLFSNFNLTKSFWLFEKIMFFVKSFLIEIKALRLSSYLGKNVFEKYLIKNKVDLVIFFSISELSLVLQKTNYVNLYLDSCHLENPEFPEIRNFNEFFRRENNYRKILNSSVFILSGSKSCSEELKENYSIKKNKIIEFVYLPQNTKEQENYNGLNNYIENRKLKEFLEEKKKFIFYPANYWSHKNHIYIIEALEELINKKNYPFYCVFCGADKQNNKSYLIERSKNLNLSDKILFLDHISTNDLIKIYKNSFAMVMPTYFGPINIPPIEAHKYGVPVLYSKKFANLDFDEEYQMPLDIENKYSLVNSLIKIYEDNDLKYTLIENGKKFYDEQIKKQLYFTNKFEKKLDQYFIKRKTWR